MSILTFVLPLLLIIVTLYSKKVEEKFIDLLVITLFFDLYANAGMMFSVGGFDVKYADISWAFVWFFSILILLHNNMNKEDAFRFLVMLISLIVTFIIELASPTLNVDDNLSRSIMVSVRLLMSLLTISAVRTISISNMLDLLEGVFCALQKFMYVVLLVEFVCKKVLRSTIFTEATIIIFGTSVNQVTWQLSRGGSYALQGLTKEPSHLAIALFVSCVIDIVLMKKGNIPYILINLFILLISGSFSSILFCVLILYLWFASSSNSAKKIGIFTVIIFAFAAIIIFSERIPIVSYYMTRLEEIFSIVSGQNVGYTSNSVRLGSISTSISYLLEKPIFGIGAGNNVGTGALMAFISSVGIIGAIVYLSGYIQAETFDNKITKYVIIVMLVGTFFTMDIGAFYSAWLIVIAEILRDQKVKAA